MQLTQANTEEAIENMTHFSGEPPETRHQLSCGGFTPGTELLTTAGPVAVSALEPGTRVYAIDPLTRVAKPKPITEVRQLSHDGVVMVIESRRTNLQMAPDHRVLYRTTDTDRPRVQRAGDLMDREAYRFINEWHRPQRDGPDSIDIINFCDEIDYTACAAFADHGHTFGAALSEGCVPCRRNSHFGYYFDGSTFKAHQQAIERLADDVTALICVLYGVATCKNIPIRDDQAEWIQENHLNLSSFVQEKLDELIEERES